MAISSPWPGSAGEPRVKMTLAAISSWLMKPRAESLCSAPTYWMKSASELVWSVPRKRSRRGLNCSRLASFTDSGRATTSAPPSTLMGLAAALRARSWMCCRASLVRDIGCFLVVDCRGGGGLHGLRNDRRLVAAEHLPGRVRLEHL